LHKYKSTRTFTPVAWNGKPEAYCTPEPSIHEETMKNTYSDNPNRCVTSLYLYRDSDVVVISAGLDGEAHAEQILNTVLAAHGLTLAQQPLVLWSTPAEFSVTGTPLLRRLFLDGTSLEWGPDLEFTDAPEIHGAATLCNAELLGSAA
jgi:hypothetical protein